jgi:hypothetical protein
MWNPHEYHTSYFFSGHDGYIMYWDKDQVAPMLEFRYLNEISSVKNLDMNPRNGKIFA